MKIGTLVLSVLAAVVAGCAAHEKAAAVKPAVPAPVADAAPPALLPDLKGLSAPASEPLACPLYAGADRPDYDAQELHCIVGWMHDAREYLAQGGKPTKYTNRKEFEFYRKTALALQARLGRFLRGERWAPARAKAEAKAAASSASGADRGHLAQQAYLEGVLAFEKGDFASARKKWKDALALDPADDDAKAGLTKLDELSR
ncbi:MAG: hypothetical protein KGM24_13185 [Elusimicrobia bacterium]|nr:hypothetical protein [Elusimicrobiota bacterium]